MIQMHTLLKMRIAEHGYSVCVTTDHQQMCEMEWSRDLMIVAQAGAAP
jgi:hypothetical protein